MYSIPFASDHLESAFGGQVICSYDLTTHCSISLADALVAIEKIFTIARPWFSTSTISKIKLSGWVNHHQRPRLVFHEGGIGLFIYGTIMLSEWALLLCFWFWWLSDVDDVIILTHSSANKAMFELIGRKPCIVLILSVAIRHLLSAKSPPKGSKLYT